MREVVTVVPFAVLLFLEADEMREGVAAGLVKAGMGCSMGSFKVCEVDARRPRRLARPRTSTLY